MTKVMTFIEVLENPQSYAILEQIEELIHETEPALVRIRENLIDELKVKFGYEYKI